MALASTMQECIYLEQLLENIDNYKSTQTVMYEDNQGTIAQRCKHVDIKYHFVRSIVNEYCTTEEMVVDIMTKPATKAKLKRFAAVMFGRDPHLYCLPACNNNTIFFCVVSVRISPT